MKTPLLTEQNTVWNRVNLLGNLMQNCRGAGGSTLLAQPLGGVQQ
jgi:hypothetical protein